MIVWEEFRKLTGGPYITQLKDDRLRNNISHMPKISNMKDIFNKVT